MYRILSTALLLAACSAEPLTQVVVSIEAEPGVLSQSQSLSVRVLDLPSVESEPPFANTNAPWHDGRFTLALSPKNPRAAGRYIVEASAQRAGLPIASARLIAGYVVGQTRYVRMMLEDACLGVPSCAEGSTCRGGACVDATVDQTQFAPSSERAPTTSALPAPTTAAPSPRTDASVPPSDPTRAGDAMVASATDAARPASTDAATPAAPDAALPSAADASTVLLADAATPVRSDAGSTLPVGAGLFCAPGYYAGNFTGSYRFGTFSTFIGVREAPVSGAAASEAAPVALLLEPDPNNASALRVGYGCMNGSVPINALERPFRARVTGSLDCTTGVFSGRLSGLLIPSDTADLDALFEGPLSAQFDASTGSLANGVWSAAEPASAGITPGEGNGRWSAAWDTATMPTLSNDPCGNLP